ncbi:MAG TPA: iron-siderophore ABC transporter substrate-binding protein [Bacillales bacterium]|nr:iron-siderophore ABC transporter substrate-binding protein [Bacillales bacterium]
MRKWLTVICAFSLLLVTACSGNTDQINTSKNEASSERTITIKDAYGKQTIKGTPENIVVLEWFYAAHLLTLGIQPAGVADVDGFSKWVSTKTELAESVQDVGTRQEPNLEAISRANPDLIIAAKFRHEQILDRLKDIAPVVTFAPYSKEAQKNLYQEMVNEFKTVSKIVDKEKEAEQEIADLNQFYKKQKQRIKDAGLLGSKYIACLAFSSQNSPILRLYTDNSIVVQVMNRLGLKNAYHSDQVEQYGFTKANVAALQNYQEEDLHFFYIVQEDDNIFENQLKGNPVWENLSFVKAGNTHHLPGDTPVFGGISSMKILAERIVDSIVKE